MPHVARLSSSTSMASAGMVSRCGAEAEALAEERPHRVVEDRDEVGRGTRPVHRAAGADRRGTVPAVGAGAGGGDGAGQLRGSKPQARRCRGRRATKQRRSDGCRGWCWVMAVADRGAVGRAGGGVEDVEELVDGDGRWEHLVGAGVATGVGDDEGVAGGEDGVEEELAVLGPAVVVAEVAAGAGGGRRRRASRHGGRRRRRGRRGTPPGGAPSASGRACTWSGRRCGTRPGTAGPCSRSARRSRSSARRSGWPPLAPASSCTSPRMPVELGALPRVARPGVEQEVGGLVDGRGPRRRRGGGRPGRGRRRRGDRPARRSGRRGRCRRSRRRRAGGRRRRGAGRPRSSLRRGGGAGGRRPRCRRRRRRGRRALGGRRRGPSGCRCPRSRWRGGRGRRRRSRSGGGPV